MAPAPIINRQWRLVSRPEGLPKPSDFALLSEPVPAPGADEVLVRNLYISIAPGMRVYIGSPQGLDARYSSGSGKVIRAWAIGRVIESRSERFPPGTYVRDRPGNAGVQGYSVLPASSLEAVDPGVVPLPAHLGVLGTQGLAAYVGLLEAGEPKPGETVVVSAAAGGVGSVAGQIARIKGCRAVGIAGGPEKCRHVVEELGFDACFDYKAGTLAEDLSRTCPDGIDVYFDNVGGEILDTCLLQMKKGGRIAFCGATAEYNATAPSAGLRNYVQILNRQLRLQGFSYYDAADRFEQARADLRAWIASGELRHYEDITVGLENFYPAFMKLFSGEGLGKLVLQVDANETA